MLTICNMLKVLKSPINIMTLLCNIIIKGEHLYFKRQYMNKNWISTLSSCPQYIRI